MNHLIAHEMISLFKTVERYTSSLRHGDIIVLDTCMISRCFLIETILKQVGNHDYDIQDHFGGGIVAGDNKVWKIVDPESINLEALQNLCNERKWQVEEQNTLCEAIDE